MLDEEARGVIGHDLSLPEAEVRESLDAVFSISHKPTVGGPSPKEVRRMVGEGLTRLDDERSRLDGRRQRLAEAQQLLKQLEKLVTGESGPR